MYKITVINDFYNYPITVTLKDPVCKVSYYFFSSSDVCQSLTVNPHSEAVFEGDKILISPTLEYTITGLDGTLHTYTFNLDTSTIENYVFRISMELYKKYKESYEYNKLIGEKGWWPVPPATKNYFCNY